MNKNFEVFLEKKGKFFHHIINKEVYDFFSEKTLKTLTQSAEISNVAEYLKKSIYEPNGYFLQAKGKKLRPILGYLAIKAFGKNPDKYKELLIVPEILHNSTLIVDDIEDNALLRRNRPAAHIKFGLDIAINAANALYYFPFHIINKSKLSRSQKEKAVNILIETMNRLHAGQGLDILWHKNHKFIVTPGQYIQMVKLKASSFFRMELQLACLIAGTDKNTEKKSALFAENLGVSFQIIDDILDITSYAEKSKKFGKIFAQDITEGKKTLIVLYALEKANKKDKNRLFEILSLHSEDERLKKEAIALLTKYGAIDKAREFLYTLLVKTWNDFSKILKPSAEKTLLKSYCEFLIRRKF